MKKRLIFPVLLFILLDPIFINIHNLLCVIANEPTILRRTRHGSSSMQYFSCNFTELQKFPQWCSLMNMAFLDEIAFLNLSNRFANAAGLLIRPFYGENPEPSSSSQLLLVDHRNTRERSTDSCSNTSLPIVLAHGMGDSCFNEGMESIVRLITNFTGLYTECIPMGANLQEDTSAGYFLNMDASVDQFASLIQANSKMTHGFHAIGFSQGNNIIRGYMAKYNEPSVHTFISINGVNAGIGAVPYCMPKRNLYLGNIDSSLKETIICRALMEMASKKAYSTFAQQHSFQANYWRDPRPEYFDDYIVFSQLARYNNEIVDKNNTWKENFMKSKKFVWVMAEKDSIVWPKEGEHWGTPDPRNPFGNKVLERKQTAWFTDDYFGLRTMEDEGRNFYEKFDGGHLQFSIDELMFWIQKYVCA